MGIMTKAVATIASRLGLTDPRLYHFFSGGRTHAGETVTIDTALQLDVVWSCVRLVSQTIATLPLFLYLRDKNGLGSAIDDKHPLYRLLHDRPNADMTATDFWQTMAASVLLWGNAYAEIDWIGTGPSRRVNAIIPMRPDRVTVRRQTDGSLNYTYSFLGQVADLTEDQVFHIKGFSLDGMIGMSPITQARQSLSSAMAAEKASGSFFRNSMQPSAYLKSPEYLSDPQRERAQELIDKFSGAINAGRVPLMEGGWEMTPLSLKPEDAQLLQTRSFHVEQMCRWFDVPPVMIGHMEKSTAWGTGMESMMQWFLTFSLRPHLKRIEHAIAKDLLTVEEQLTRYAEFNVEGLLRADSAARAQLYKVLVENGLRTRNEVRALDNEPPHPDGDDLTVMSNMLPIQLLGKEAQFRQLKPLDPNYVPPGPSDPAGSQLPDGSAAKSAATASAVAAAKPSTAPDIDMKILVDGMRDTVVEAVRKQPQPIINVPVTVTLPKKGKEITTVTSHDETGRIKTFERQEAED